MSSDLSFDPVRTYSQNDVVYTVRVWHSVDVDHPGWNYSIKGSGPFSRQGFRAKTSDVWLQFEQEFPYLKRVEFWA
jgi:hypothetical protein